MSRATRGIVVAVAAALMLAFGNVALADHLKAVCEVQAAASAKMDQGYVLSVHIHTTDGKPVNETAVRFYQVVDFFGQREMYLGSAVTDGQGNAALAYLPAELGPHQILVRSAAKEHVGSAEGRTTFQATVAAAAYRPEAVPLADFSKVVTAVVGAIVLTVWALIAFAFVSTARGVRRGARDLGPKGDHA